MASASHVSVGDIKSSNSTLTIILSDVVGILEKYKTGDWSSIIGIITAIVGNILISFALNTQRYAHVRLEREAHGQLSRSETGDRSNRHSVEDGYDTLRRGDSIRDGHTDLNAVKLDGANGFDHGEGSDETDTLIKRNKARYSTSSPSLVDQEERSTVGQKKNYLRSPYWWTGIILMVIGEAGNFLAYGFAPASIVSPLGVVALISNCLIAPIMLKEPFRKRDPVGVIIAIAGAVTVVLSAKGSNPKLGPDKIWELISRWEFIAYFIVTVILIVAFMLASNKYGGRTIVIDIGLVGLFGGYTALSTKGIASLLSYRLFQLFTFGISYLLAIVLIVTAVMQIKYVNRALQRFDSTQVIPAQFVIFTIFVVLGSAILYRDFESTTGAKIAQFIGGVILTFLGVWTITSGRQSENQKHEYRRLDEEEQPIDMIDEEALETPTNENIQNPTPPNQTSYSSQPTPAAPSTPPHQRQSIETAETPGSFMTASSRFPPSSTLRISKPPMIQAASSPLLPSENIPHHQSQPRTPTTTAKNNPSQSQQEQPSRPSTTLLHTQSENSTPSTPQAASNPNLPSSIPRTSIEHLRHSLTSGITPGPFTSPISGGLSAVVADNRRRRESLGRGVTVLGTGIRQADMGHERRRSSGDELRRDEVFYDTRSEGLGSSEGGVEARRERHDSYDRGGVEEVGPSGERI